MQHNEGLFIVGIDKQGKKFRPSDWAERLASAFGHYNSCQRFCYDPQIVPACRDNQYGLFITSTLAVDNPVAYCFIVDFATDNQLEIREFGQPDSFHPVLQNIA